jgi:hypothetical protein
MGNSHNADDQRPGGGTAGESPTFLPEGAFVVQFKTGTGALGNPLIGRAEHVVSGRATHFRSPAELLAFLSDVLRSHLAHGQVPAMQDNQDPTGTRGRC